MNRLRFGPCIDAVCVAGGPNSNDFAANHIIHHTVGLPDLKQQCRCVDCDLLVTSAAVLQCVVTVLLNSGTTLPAQMVGC